MFETSELKFKGCLQTMGGCPSAEFTPACHSGSFCPEQECSLLPSKARKDTLIPKICHKLQWTDRKSNQLAPDIFAAFSKSPNAASIAFRSGPMTVFAQASRTMKTVTGS